MISAFQNVQGNPMNLKINKEMRVFIVYIWWVPEHPVTVGVVGGGVWNIVMHGFLVLPYCSLLFFREGQALPVSLSLITLPNILPPILLVPSIREKGGLLNRVTHDLTHLF